MNDETMSALAELFVALSDKTRLRLLGLIGDGEVSVGYLADSLGESQPKVSRHLAYLRGAGLVSTRRDGKWVYYGIVVPEDAAQSHVLRETLRALGAGFDSAAQSPGDAYQEPRPRTSPVNYELYDGYADTEYVPQEIEIYLL